MVSGHSYLPNDRDFGSIETAKRQAGQVYVPEEWYQLVRDSRRANAFHVEEMERDNFVSLASVKENVNRKATLKKQKVDWLSIRWIQVTKDKPFAFKYRCSLNSLEQWKVVDVKRKRQKSCNVHYHPEVFRNGLDWYKIQPVVKCTQQAYIERQLFSMVASAGYVLMLIRLV